MTEPYVLHAAAEADLREIVRYSRQQWGDEQTRRYADQLKRGMQALAAGIGRFKGLNNILPGLRVSRCGRHFLFCLSRPDAPPLILAIFHEHMDQMARLARRLA